MATYRVTMNQVEVEADTPDAAVRLAVAGPTPATFRVVEMTKRESWDQGREVLVDSIALAER